MRPCSPPWPETIKPGDTLSITELGGSEAEYFPSRWIQCDLPLSFEWDYLNLEQPGWYRVLTWASPENAIYENLNGDETCFEKFRLIRVAEDDAPVPEIVLAAFTEVVPKYSTELGGEGGLLAIGNAVFPYDSTAAEACTISVTPGVGSSPLFTVTGIEDYGSTAVYGYDRFVWSGGVYIVIEPVNAQPVPLGLHTIVAHIAITYGRVTRETDVTIPVQVVDDKATLAAALPKMPTVMNLGDTQTIPANGLQINTYNCFAISSRCTTNVLTAKLPGVSTWEATQEYINGELTIADGAIRVQSSDPALSTVSVDDVPFEDQYVLYTASTQLYLTTLDTSSLIGQTPPSFFCVVSDDAQGFTVTSLEQYTSTDDNSNTVYHDMFTLDAVAPLLPGKHTATIYSPGGVALSKIELHVLSGAPAVDASWKNLTLTLPQTYANGDWIPDANTLSNQLNIDNPGIQDSRLNFTVDVSQSGTAVYGDPPVNIRVTTVVKGYVVTLLEKNIPIVP